MSAPSPARTPPSPADLREAGEVVRAIQHGFASKVVGQAELGRSLLVTLMSGGHILLESVPGLAKTLAASTLAGTVKASFARIQCTPDLLPSDIIGTQVFDAHTSDFITQLGPVHANFVLLDEINRSSAKTQSAMLEAMQERQTTIGGETHRLPEPFMVLATQNPIEEEGTYVLPQAQMDRFLLKEVVGYPHPEEEFEVLNRIESGALDDRAVDAVVGPEQIFFLRGLVERVYVDAAIKRYIVALINATRHPEQVVGSEMASYLEFGASPRGAIAMLNVARAVAVLNGRDHVLPEDVGQLRNSILRHRLVLTFEAVADRVQPERVIDAIFRAVPTP
ncbi:MAG: AAA family ATPase [Propionibacteriaceae bacterium]